MAIKIADKEDDIWLTREEHERYGREYDRLTHMVDKPTFDEYVRGRISGIVKAEPIQPE